MRSNFFVNLTFVPAKLIVGGECCRALVAGVRPLVVVYLGHVDV